MDKETTKRLNKIIDNTEVKCVPVQYIKLFIVTEPNGDEYSLTKEEFYDFVEDYEDEGLDMDFVVSFILDYKKIRRDIKLISNKILEEG